MSERNSVSAARATQDQPNALAGAWTSPLLFATSASAMWWEWCARQLSLTANLVDAMGFAPRTPATAMSRNHDAKGRDEGEDSSRGPRANLVAAAARVREPESVPPPVKGYETLTAQQIVAKIHRLRDPEQVDALLRFESANKRRKSVTAAGRAQLRRLREAS